MTPVLDAHGHIGSWFNFFSPDPSPDALVRTMDRVGVTAIGVSDMLAVGPDARAGNRRALDAAARHPGRVFVWLVFNPHHTDSHAQLSEYLDDPVVWGIKLHPDVHQCPLDDPRYEPALQLAQRHGVPVLSHAETGSRWSDPSQFRTVADRFPGVPLLMGHCGLWPHGFARAAQLVADRPSVFLETCGSQMTGRWIARLVALAGADRVVFGSDACFLDVRVGLGRVALAPLDEADRALVLGGNLNRLLKEPR